MYVAQMLLLLGGAALDGAAPFPSQLKAKP